MKRRTGQEDKEKKCKWQNFDWLGTRILKDLRKEGVHSLFSIFEEISPPSFWGPSKSSIQINTAFQCRCFLVLSWAPFLVMLHTPPGWPQMLLCFCSYLNAEDSSNYSPKLDPSLEPRAIPLSGLCCLMSPGDILLNMRKTTHQFCASLFSKPASSFSMSCLFRQHDHSPRPETWMNPCLPLLSHDHDFSSNHMSFSPGWLSEIPISGLISF